MEIVKAMKDGLEVVFLKCEIHNWFYAGRPPLTTGCHSCWMTYYTGQRALDKGDRAESLDLLEAAIHHIREETDAGRWDFVPDFKIDIEKDGIN